MAMATLQLNGQLSVAGLTTSEVPHSPVPIIEISFAPEEVPIPEPYSPFSPMKGSFGIQQDDGDCYRPSLLSPPIQGFQLSPLRPLSSGQNRPQENGKGLGSEQFQHLLRMSKEKSSVMIAKKQDLRREVALKAHKNRQLERRALFLSKIGAPPSPTAVSLPKTPPESPAVFHYSLPSPGLVSPLALFESLEEQGLGKKGERKVWVEQVDFRLARKHADERLQVAPKDQDRRKGHARIPSLEQITERYGAYTAVPTPVRARERIPLPAFLNSRRQSPSPPPKQKPSQSPIGTGRLRFPSRPSTPSDVESDSDSSTNEGTIKARPALLSVAHSPRQRTYALPSSPVSPQPPVLQVTTTLIPRTSSSSPVKLTEANLHALNSRARTARDMLSAIRRRTAVYGADISFPFFPSPHVDEMEKGKRRHSAPAELPRRVRSGFAHPVLNLPGGF